MSSDQKGRFTIRTAGFLFFLSSLFELFALTSQVPLFGAVRSGAVAVTYHLVYVLIFLSIGVGLWGAKPWTLKGVFGGTLVYSIDKVSLLLTPRTMETHLLQQLAEYEELIEILGKAYVLQVMSVTLGAFVLGWWGFAIYLYVRRDYFIRPHVSSVT